MIFILQQSPEEVPENQRSCVGRLQQGEHRLQVSILGGGRGGSYRRELLVIFLQHFVFRLDSLHFPWVGLGGNFGEKFDYL